MNQSVSNFKNSLFVTELNIETSLLLWVDDSRNVAWESHLKGLNLVAYGGKVAAIYWPTLVSTQPLCNLSVCPFRATVETWSIVKECSSVDIKTSF